MNIIPALKPSPCLPVFITERYSALFDLQDCIYNGTIHFMKTKRLLALITASVLLLASLCGCETYDNFRKAFFDKNEDDTPVIKIGVFEPFTGSYAQEAAKELAGMELANSMYNTVLGCRIELVSADNQSDFNQSKNAAQQLVDQGVSVVLGSYGSVLSIAASDIFKDNKIPAIAATCTNPIITQTSDYYFRVCIIDTFEGQAAAQYVVNGLKIPAAAVLVQDGDDYGIAKADAFIETFAEEVKDYVPPEDIADDDPDIDIPEPDPEDVEEYDPDDYEEIQRSIPDYGTITFKYSEQEPKWSELFAKIYRAGFDVIYFPSKLDAAEAVIAQARSEGYDFTWIGTSEWDGTGTIGVCYTNEYEENTTLSTMTEAFLAAYKEKYGEGTPADETALGFDAYRLAVESIRAAGTAEDGELIAKTILNIKGLSGATGTITMNSTGDPEKSVIIEKITDTGVEVVFTTDPH